MLLEFLANPSQAGRQIPVLEGGAIAQGTGFLHQHRQVVPGIVDHLVTPELARMLRHDLAVAEHDDALGVAAHQDHPAGDPGSDTVAIVIGHDQAGGGGTHRLVAQPLPGLKLPW